MKRLMKGVEDGASSLGVWTEQNGAWDVPATVQLFENIKHLFNYPTKNNKIRRCKQISWITVYNLFKEHGYQFANVGVGAI